MRCDIVKKSTNAILFTLLAFVGLGGVGHFYLGRFKQGLLFLMGGIIIEFIGMFVMFGSAAFGVEYVDYLKFLDTTFLYGLVIYFTITVTHIIYIVRKNK